SCLLMYFRVSQLQELHTQSLSQVSCSCIPVDKVPKRSVSNINTVISYYHHCHAVYFRFMSLTVPLTANFNEFTMKIIKHQSYEGVLRKEDGTSSSVVINKSLHFRLLVFSRCKFESRISNGVFYFETIASLTRLPQLHLLFGCAPYPKDCKMECVSIATDGCIVCKCPSSNSGTGSGSVSGTQTSVLTGSTGCPTFPKGCPMACVSIDTMGCVLCKCSNNTQDETCVWQLVYNVPGTVVGSNTNLVNGPGCAPFDEHSCQKSCIKTDKDHCLVCDCSTGERSFCSSCGRISKGSGRCPPFDVSNCDMSCVGMDSMGCLSCNCPLTTTASSAGGTTQVPSSGGTTQAPSSGGGQGAGGCPPFDVSVCDMDCVSMDDNGCLSCNCPASTVAPSGGTTQAPSSGGGQGAGGCPPFDVSTCDMDCVSMDANGCLSCNCAASTASTVEFLLKHISPGATNSSSSGNQTSGGQGAGGCPPFDASVCDLNCVSMDSSGCLTCNCAASTVAPSEGSSQAPSSGGGQGAGGCPPFDVSTCDMDCVSMDANGCLSCNCPASTEVTCRNTTQLTCCSVTCIARNVSGGGQGAGGCPPFDVSTCDMSCVVMDSSGCLSCNCPLTTVSSGSNTTVAPVTTQSPQGSGGCPAFDASSCDMSCVAMDSNGCLSCHCPDTTGNKIQTTLTFTIMDNSGPFKDDFAVWDLIIVEGRTILSTAFIWLYIKLFFSTSQRNPTKIFVSVKKPSPLLSSFKLTKSANGKYLVLISMVSLIESVYRNDHIHLTLVSSGPNTTVVTGTTQSPQGAGGCPAFDASTCDMSCVAIDSNGCLSCHCPDTTVASVTTTAAASGTTASSGGGQGAGGCPTFDVSTCDMNCVSMDSNGCLGCNCPVTTDSISSVTTTTAASGTTASSGGGQGAGGCPAFDVSTCDMNCVSMDSNGCLDCNCPVTTVAPASTAAPTGTTNAPSGTTSGGNGNNGGCPAFDANQCDIKCTKMDVNGCLHCECPASNNSTVNTFGPGTLGSGTGGTSGNNGGCSAINPGCDLSCLQINSNGCVICSCKSTSIKPLVLTTKAHVTLPTTATAPVTTTAILTTKVPMATTDSNECPPIRCVAPCNVGITFGPDNCPICKCKN
ncbi:Hypothetical predicted protein, partial [Mytilus galloprovincialis]